MSVLSIYPDNQPRQGKHYTDFIEIERELAAIDVKFERWTANRELSSDADQDTIIAAYQDAIDNLKQLYRFQSVDVISLSPDHPQKQSFGKNFSRNTRTMILKYVSSLKVAGYFIFMSTTAFMQPCVKKAISSVCPPIPHTGLTWVRTLALKSSVCLQHRKVGLQNLRVA